MDRPDGIVAMKLNLHQRINEVRRHNEYIQKKKKVEGGGYLAVTHDQVTAELRKDLIEQGVLVFPAIVPGTHRVVDTGTKTKNGIPFIRLEADVKVTFVNVDDAKDREEMVLPAHAIDQGDKAPGKLMSYAQKYALLKMFSIETGDDEESRHVERDGANEMTDNELANWQAKVDEVTTRPELDSLWKDKIQPRCKEIGDKTAYNKLYARVTAKAAQMKKPAAKKEAAHA
jgi:hypothetical protein